MRREVEPNNIFRSCETELQENFKADSKQYLNISQKAGPLNDYFQCDLCKKVFRQKKYLVKHLKRHRSPLVQCSDCPKEFATRSCLLVHWQSTHQLEGCQLCGEQFNSTSLRKHLREHHKPDSEERNM